MKIALKRPDFGLNYQVKYLSKKNHCVQQQVAYTSFNGTHSLIKRCLINISFLITHSLISINKS